ncbi:uncharacterized protein [Triticum aestivum]|uniref:uncharacterized protein isoform X1 n=1 Tax=Triticum aestivum TaxID=4565 RepID=UPI001D02708A|nr:uncharacterized protein LOC123106370 isoform X1 [Triticum aestivum]
MSWTTSGVLLRRVWLLASAYMAHQGGRMGDGHRGMKGDGDLCGVGHTGSTSIRAAAAAQVLPARRPEDGGVTASPPSQPRWTRCGPRREEAATRRIREALALADDLLERRLKVASDCLGVVNDINKGTGEAHAAIVHEITSHSNSFAFCAFVHESRNHNFEAHNVAKFACNLSVGRHAWLGNPHDLVRVPMNILE